MTRRFKTVLFAAAALLILGSNNASAQGIGPATFPSECKATVSITAVQYLGKENSKDKILVKWSATKPISACIEIREFRVDVKVVRQHGHEDSASKVFPGTDRSGIIEVPRAALETDPASFDVNLNAKVAGEKDRTIKLTGSGTPSITGTSLSPGSQGPCDPTIKVTALNFFPAETPTKDALGVFWDATATDPCLLFVNFRVSVKVTRADGAIQNSNSGLLPSSTRSARIELPKSVGIVSFEVTVETHLSALTTNVVFSARKQGTF